MEGHSMCQPQCLQWLPCRCTTQQVCLEVHRVAQHSAMTGDVQLQLLAGPARVPVGRPAWQLYLQTCTCGVPPTSVLGPMLTCEVAACARTVLAFKLGMLERLLYPPCRSLRFVRSLSAPAVPGKLDAASISPRKQTVRTLVVCAMLSRLAEAERQYVRVRRHEGWLLWALQAVLISKTSCNHAYNDMGAPYIFIDALMFAPSPFCPFKCPDYIIH
jgi:hypothetical protein